MNTVPQSRIDELRVALEHITRVLDGTTKDLNAHREQVAKVLSQALDGLARADALVRTPHVSAVAPILDEAKKALDRLEDVFFNPQDKLDMIDAIKAHLERVYETNLALLQAPEPRRAEIRSTVPEVKAPMTPSRRSLIGLLIIAAIFGAGLDEMAHSLIPKADFPHVMVEVPPKYAHPVVIEKEPVEYRPKTTQPANAPSTP